MAMRRFSREELYSLRNDIPIDRVIKNALDIPWRISEGCFRFLCPLCNGFNTAVNPETNLARCFCCKKNFNTIDLVMVITQSDFVHSIRLLKEFQQKYTPNQIPSIKPNAKTREKGLEHIGNVLKAIVAPQGPISPGCGSGEKLCNRILALEKKLEGLAQRIEEITKSLS
jgi:DNA primase